MTRGSYSYIDANAQLQHVDYVADAGGFRVAATNLPVHANVAPVDHGQAPLPVEDTEEVKQARAEHLAAVAAAQADAGSSEGSDDDTETIEAPQPVEDTVEVKQAREEHLAAVEEAKARSQEAPADPIVIADHHLHAPLIAQQHLVHAAPLVQWAHSPVLLRAAPANSFAYSVYAPGHTNVVQVA